MKTYAIADLHGRRDLLDLAIARISALGGGTVVFLGDYIDRGPDSRGVVVRLMEEPPPGQIWRCVAGNHEAYLIFVFNDPSMRDDWIRVGGRETLLSYGWDGQGEAPMDIIPIAHRRFLKGLQLHCQDAHRFYVHAGVDPTIALADQTEQRLLWSVYSHDLDIGYGHRHVVHGHEPRIEGPICLTHRTNLDTKAWETGTLTIGVFDDDLPGGPVEIIKIKAE